MQAAPRSSFPLLLLALLAPSGCDSDHADLDAAESDDPMAFRSACGDEPAVAPNADGDTSSRAWLPLPCDTAAGEVFVGIVTREWAWGSMDGVGSICRAPDGTTRQIIPGDIDPGNPAEPLVDYECPPGEHVVGIAYKDADPYPGVPGDTSDGATVICDGAGRLAHPELDVNNAPFQIVGCEKNEVPIGVAYVDREQPYSDLTDAVSVVCEATCETCEDPDAATLAPNPDTGPRPYLEMSCDIEAGETLAGVAVREWGSGSMDGMGPVCRLPDGSTRQDLPSDIDPGVAGQPVLEYVCPPGDRVTAIAYKDASPVAGIPGDTMDSVTVVCESAGQVAHPELDANNAPFQIIPCGQGEVAIGVAYKDRENPYSDLAEAATLVCVEACEPEPEPEPKAALPDLRVVSVEEFGCTGSGGQPVVRVTVANDGAVTANGWVDVFTGLAAPPAIGEYSSIYRMSDPIPPGGSQAMSFAITSGFTTGWVDALVDTTQTVAESDEGNNHGEAYVLLPDCSFN